MSDNDNDKYPVFDTDIITAKQDASTNIFYIEIPYTTKDGLRDVVNLSLNAFLSIVTQYKGTWQSLGMAYNPLAGINCMQISIHYVVPQGGGYHEHLWQLLSEIISKRQEGNTNEPDKEVHQSAD